MRAVIPGHAEGMSPEPMKRTGSMELARGFRVLRFAKPRNDSVWIGAALIAAFLAAPAQAIVGGQESAAPLAREAVMVLSSKGGMCSAVIVAADVVLTAGHCSAGPAVVWPPGLCAGGAGQHRVHWRGEDGAPELVEPTAKAIHPGYDAKAVEARRRSIDLALIRLPQHLPARFAAANLSAATPSAPARVPFGGYGVAKEGDARSSGTFRTAELPVAEPYGRSTILIWAEGDGRAGPCMGDSGGPVAQGGAVFAITTWVGNKKSGACGKYSQGVLLGPQREWIDRTLAGWGRKARWE